MKMIVALIRPHQLPSVKQALFDRQITHFTATNVLGTAPTAEQRMYRGVERQVELFKRVRLEIAVSGAFVDPCLEALQEGAAETGGHGKVFVMELLDVMTLWNGERGPKAL
jgi:nitrogen regulatory protein P-II 1